MSKLWYMDNSTGISNAPGNSCFIYQKRTPWGYVQFAISHDCSWVKIRAYSGTSWCPWYKVSVSST